MKAVRLLIESSLPPELRKPDREYSAGDLNDLLVQVAKTHPDSYEKISSMLADFGRNASFKQGETLTLEDLRPVIDKQSIFATMRKDIAKAKAESKTDDEFAAKRLKIWGDYSDLIEKETQKAALAKNNNIALAVLSGARGKSTQLKTMISTPGIYADSKGRPVPLFIENSHSDGLRPYEYLASTYGARSTVTSTKNSTAKGGDFAKQMVSITAPLVVTNKKSPTANGIDIDLDDDSLKYRVLSKSLAGYPAGTLITSRVLSDLRKSDAKYAMVYSPLTDTSEEGISAESVGGLNGGKLYNLGASAGITSSQAIGEPITQMALNAKHCLLEGTQVRMADFSIRKIEDIKPWEYVLGADITGKTFPVKVKAVWDQGVQPVFKYTYGDLKGKSRIVLESTDCHQVLSSKDAGHEFCKLPAGIGEENITVVVVDIKKPSSINKLQKSNFEFLGNKQCWDISVDHVDELFVLANGLIVKNTGGVAGKKKTFAGFNTINQFVQSPEAFANKATVSELDGMVEKIDPAPQGGNYVYINGQEHYTPPGYELTVKLGDTVEPGDALSDGIADPRDIVRLRGLGEGRKYYATRLKTILDDSGIKTDRKHTEMVARAALDHLVVTDPDGLGNYLPDDEISYNAMAANYVPPKDTVKVDPTKSVGKYLQAPALHYTIGTKLTKRMAQHLADRQIGEVFVSDTEPGFTPSMTRLRTAAHSMPDWLAKMQTSYLGKNLQESAVRGEDTNVAENVHFAPRLAIGTGFGSKSEQTGKF